MTALEALTLRGDAGCLEALWQPHPGAAGAALVCHSHPEYGGSVRDRVVHRMARALGAAGFAVLRFNFRGVGASEGRFDGGRGERDDVRAAIDHLARAHGRVLVAGYSFGAWVGLAAGAADPRVSALCGVGAPADVFDFAAVRDVGKPLLVVQGDRDEWGSLAHVRAAVAAAGARGHLAVIPGADHAFRGGLDAMMGAVEGFARQVSLRPA